MIQKPFDAVTKEDIDRLVTEQVAEGRTLDYKQELPEGNDKAKKGFLADVSAFANSGGGDLVYGVTEKRDAQNRKTGIPERAEGLGSIAADDVKQRLQSIVNNGLDPRIPGFHIKAIDGFPDGPVIFVRVAKSWAAPHMITFQGDSRFYVRSNTVNHPMDVREIRAAFEGAAGVTQRIQRFVWDRLGRIVAGETPLLLKEKSRFVLHFLPLASFEGGRQIDLQAAVTHDKLLEGLYLNAYHRFNFDGRVSYGPNQDGSECYGYCQLFRNGAVEAVETTFIRDLDGRRWIVANEMEYCTIKAIGNYLRLAEAISLSPPFFVVMSLVGVRGLTVYKSSRNRFWIKGYAIERDQLTVPEILIEDPKGEVDTMLKPCFDAIWQASGYDKSLNFDESNKWKPPD